MGDHLGDQRLAGTAGHAGDGRQEGRDGTRLVLYNTRTHAKEPFAPIDPARVRMYVCGPTVYDDAHIGNARPVIVFDVLFRLLRHVFGADAVTYVRNITDVDDKINARAARDHPDLPLNEAIRRVTEGTHARFEAAVAALGNLPPTVEPRATEHIAEMRAIIERLVARGVAYVADGHVLFSVSAMGRIAGVPAYGSLARRSLDEMVAGARVDVASYKRDEMDFVLWKPSSAGEPGWPSPAGIDGLGRPGWHIECSAMAWKHLVAPFAGRLACTDAEAETFDIHGGGIDLVFPHHENEVAQTCCAFGIPRMANVWMHNGFLQVEGEKMSKSLGNFVTIADVLKDWPGEVARLAMLKTHYRQPIDWTVRGLEEAERNLARWYADPGEPAGAPDASALAALADDLNTPAAIAALHHAAPAARRAALALMGFSGDPAALARSAEGLDIATVEALVAERTAARAAKNWAESDRLRDVLAGMGVTVKDSKEGTTWEVSR
ncbi:cysteine--tRNA ligase [Salinarimonas sp. NSM]|uniref:cysteine--tRNA ligase n=1 Tax=Salinarimonas sp. NSM TaxID=3458003 RepID=UPI004036AAF9